MLFKNANRRILRFLNDEIFGRAIALAFKQGNPILPLDEGLLLGQFFNASLQIWIFYSFQLKLSIVLYFIWTIKDNTWGSINRRWNNYLSGEDGPSEKENSDSAAPARHGENQDQVGDPHRRQEEVPEPEEHEDLLGDDVWGKDAEVLRLRDVPALAVGLEVALGRPERLCQL